MSSLTFAAPYMLWALVSFPLFWWLMRLTPPKPKTELFPAFKLLQSLPTTETETAKTPWWITLIRLLLLALLIVAFAKPQYKNTTLAELNAQKPLVIMVDNSFAAYPQKKQILQQAQALIAKANQATKPIYIVPTIAGPHFEVGPFKNDEAREVLKKTQFIASQVDRKQAFARLQQIANDNPKNGLNIAYLTDGLATQQDEDAFANLRKSSRNSQIYWYQPKKQPLIAITKAENQGTGLNYSLVRPKPNSASLLHGVIKAYDLQGRLIGQQPFQLADKQNRFDGKLELPVAVLNDIAYLRLENSPQSPIEDRFVETAAGTYLLDTSNKQKTVALLAPPIGQLSHPLLSSGYYISKALENMPQVVGGKALQIEASTPEETVKTILDAHPSLIILDDQTNLTDKIQQQIANWVQNGGTLLRFAGQNFVSRNKHQNAISWQTDDNRMSTDAHAPNNAQNAMKKSLLPVTMRTGERSFGGALSWEKPQKITDFTKHSPFYGLTAPKDVQIYRQILAEPSAQLAKKSWITLSDGTPLVTASPLGKGRLIFVHTGLAADWSNLALSGFFVQMMQKIVNVAGNRVEKTNTKNLSGKLAPYQIITADGGLEPAPSFVQPITYDPEKIPQPSYNTPAGFFGSHNALYSLNLFKETSQMQLLAVPNLKNLTVETYATNKINWQKWLLLTAIFLFLIDMMISLCLKTGLFLKHGKISYFAKRGASTSPNRLHKIFRASNFTRKNSNKWLLFLASFVALNLSLPHQQTEAATSHNSVEKTANETQPNASNNQIPPAMIGPDGQQLDSKQVVALAGKTHLAYVLTDNDEIDGISKSGLKNLSKYIEERTTVEPGRVVGVHLGKDELSFYPLLYWPIDEKTKKPSPEAIKAIADYMHHGGTVFFDTRDAFQTKFELDADKTSPNTMRLRQILSRLDIPPLIAAPKDHVIARSFYLMPKFPGRYNYSPLWIAANSDASSTSQSPIRAGDGVSPILITANDFAGAWADDGQGSYRFPVIPEGENQRIWAFRGGVNIIMYVLTGNYKADQIYAPELLKRLQ